MNTINEIVNAVNTKNEEAHTENVNALVNEIFGGLDEYSRNQVLKTAQETFKGSKGRIKSPFTVEKPQGTGKRGRPALSEEEKTLRDLAKAEKKAAELKAKLQA